MYHTIWFNRDLTVDLEVSPKEPLEPLSIRKGVRHRAQVKPSVVETAHGPVEVADLFFPNGTATRAVPYKLFCFADE